jgi:hypothetical protein
MKKIKCCPRCKRPVEAKDHMKNLFVLGMLDSLLPTINCECGYSGLPIELNEKEYWKWVK